MLRVIKFYLIFIFVCDLNSLVIYAKPPTTEMPATTHIVSYVEQRKSKMQKQQLREFDFEPLNGSAMPVNKPARILQQQTDDLESLNKNTLENTNDKVGLPEQHESTLNKTLFVGARNDIAWHRVKQSIPVLQPIKHLLDHINNGEGNHTVHRKLLADSNNSTTESAIETEMEREMINESNELGFLEFFGSLGVTAWEFISNIFKFFINASGGLFSGSIG